MGSSPFAGYSLVNSALLNLRGQKNSKIQGNIGLLHAMLWCEEQGYRVFLPLTDSQDDDLVVRIDGKLYSVQVRSVYCQTEYGVYQVNLRVSGGNRSGTGKVKLFDPSLYDYLFVVTDEGNCYLIPSSEIEVRHHLNLGEKYAKYKVK